jgi:hypothetical protein
VVGVGAVDVRIAPQVVGGLDGSDVVAAGHRDEELIHEREGVREVEPGVAIGALHVRHRSERGRTHGLAGRVEYGALHALSEIGVSDSRSLPRG